MAKINHATLGIEDHASFVSLASLGIMLCMIVSLVGIKIWWFKHRLTFDQTSTSNGAAGGSQPAVVLTRHRSSRDNRMSKQIPVEPVVGHGVFRMRGEDEMEFERPNQLPPVRIGKRSKSTPSLLLPPYAPQLPTESRRHEVQSTAFEVTEPPKRNPPTPPTAEELATSSVRDASTPPSPPFFNKQSSLSIPEDFSTHEEFELQFQRMENNIAQTNISADNFMEQSTLRESPPLAPRRLNRGISSELSERKYIKAKANFEPEVRQLTDRRLTGYFGSSKEDSREVTKQQTDVVDALESSVEEFGDRRLTGYIKYTEIDAMGLEDCQGNSEDNREDEEKLGHTQDDFWKHANKEQSLWQDIELTAPKHTAENILWSKVEPTVGTFDANSIEFKNESINVENGSTIENEKSWQFIEDNTREQLETTLSTQHEVEFQVMKVVDKTIVSSPTKNVVSEVALFDDLTGNQNSPIEGNDLWLEMEKDIDTNFASNIEEEFNKIRHSYVENEGDFLEMQEEMGKQMGSGIKPQGFGKSIDEDWVNFENLQHHELNITFEEATPNEKINTIEEEIMLQTNTPTIEYVSNMEEELCEEYKVKQYKVYESNIQVQLAEEFNFEAYKTEITSLDEQSISNKIINTNSTDFEHITADLMLKEDAESFEVLPTVRKTKSRQKVTFDFNTEEYYLPPNHNQEYNSDDEDEYEHEEESTIFVPPTIPKPMQRMTKTLHTEDSTTLPILFSTQISEEDTTSPHTHDSWSVIRQHRYLSEEFQQNSVSEPMRSRDPPKPAYRNPLAQMSMQIAAQERYTKPRTMRDIKNEPSSSQQTETLNFDEARGTNSTTEA